MSRRLRTPKERFEQITGEKLFFLSDGLLGIQPEKRSLRQFFLEGGRKETKRLWDQNKGPILEAWIRAHPGRRPELWWTFDAPHPQRKRLGGVGTPNHEVLNYEPSFHCGIPDSGWITQFDADYYNGRAVDVNGDLIPCQWKEGDFAGKPIDASNPPTFESQAAYLKRHNLFAAGEEKRLKPRDFEPEAVTIPEEDDASSAEEPSATIQQRGRQWDNR